VCTGAVQVHIKCSGQNYNRKQQQKAFSNLSALSETDFRIKAPRFHETFGRGNVVQSPPPCVRTLCIICGETNGRVLFVSDERSAAAAEPHAVGPRRLQAGLVGLREAAEEDGAVAAARRYVQSFTPVCLM